MSHVTFDNSEDFDRASPLTLQFSLATRRSLAVSVNNKDVGGKPVDHHGASSSWHLPAPNAILTYLPELRFNPAGFGWKSYKDEANTPTTFNGADVRGATWLRCVMV